MTKEVHINVETAGRIIPKLKIHGLSEAETLEFNRRFHCAMAGTIRAVRATEVERIAVIRDVLERAGR